MFQLPSAIGTCYKGERTFLLVDINFEELCFEELSISNSMTAEREGIALSDRPDKDQ